ncbi:MAG: DUF5711 family protein [Oscillospiraceae bacterium]|nr:DUF5711 family protein [Oscillospiraceae bacterium]
MNDEITAARKKRVQRIRRRRTAWFLFALAVVSLAVLLANTLTATTFLDIKDVCSAIFAPYGSYPVALESAGAVSEKQMSMAYAVLSEDAVTVYSQRGSILGSFAHNLITPELAAAGNRAVLYNIGGKEIVVYNRTSELARFKTEYNIIDAAVSKRGTLAVLTRSDKYTAQLSVYGNGKYEQTMTWSTNAGFPLLVRLQSDGDAAAVACIAAVNGQPVSVVTVIDTRSAEALFTAQVNGIAADILLDSGVTVVTDETAELYSMAGEQKAAYVYGDAPLLHVAHDEGSGLALAFGDNSRPQINSVVLLGGNLTVKATAQGVGAVRDMYLTRTGVYILGAQRITEYNMSGEAKAYYSADSEAFALIKTSGLLTLCADRLEKAEHIQLSEEA